jgi:hypothetical protein
MLNYQRVTSINHDRRVSIIFPQLLRSVTGIPTWMTGLSSQRLGVLVEVLGEVHLARLRIV